MEYQQPTWNLQQEKKYPYDGTLGTVFEEVHGQTKFLMKSALDYTFDEKISNDLIPTEKLNYNEVVNFEFLTPSKTLDLTWMHPDDIIMMVDNPQYNTLNSVAVKIDNLIGSYFPHDSKSKININLDLHAENSKMSLLSQIKTFQSFLDYNETFTTMSSVSSVSFSGFNPVVKAILSSCAKKNHLNVIQPNQIKTQEPELSR